MNDIQADYIVERRAEPRCPVCISMEAIPYDSHGHRANQPFTAVTKDVSASGISFLHDAVILDRFLLVRFHRLNQHNSQQIVLEVSRRRQVWPLWEIAGKVHSGTEAIQGQDPLA
ncbi:MAG TPA: PilZ domain-containing protein [Pirellulales bacterium]|jgi:hypothetical protein|nr:PilZ domain-containing protein [Pirellulales bacterium]